MLLCKTCPKCLGDMTEEADSYGEYRLCLYCGFVQEGSVRRYLPLVAGRSRLLRALETLHEPPLRKAS